MTGLPTPARALAVVAHPDDAELHAGGLLAKWCAGGCEVSIVVCTDGSKGSWDPVADTAELVRVRQDEQRAAARQLGATGECVFLGAVDGELEASLARRGEVAAAIRRLRPEVVVAHDPWKRYRLHPDHRAAGFLAVDGVVAARDPHFYPEQGLPPWRPSALLLCEPDEPNHVEDVAAFVDVQVAALLRHRSQLRSTFGIDDPDDPTQVDRLLRRRLAEESPGGERYRLLTDL